MRSQETNYVRVNAVANCPILPIFERHDQFKVNEPVRQRRRHAESYSTISLSVTSSNNRNSLRKLVLANSAIQNQLIRSSLNRLRSSIDFVKEQNSVMQFCVSLTWKLTWLAPLHRFRLRIVERDAFKISRLHQEQPKINNWTILALADLRDNIRLANARRSPNHARTTN